METPPWESRPEPRTGTQGPHHTKRLLHALELEPRRRDGGVLTGRIRGGSAEAAGLTPRLDGARPGFGRGAVVSGLVVTQW
jgi:hypothetical protein